MQQRIQSQNQVFQTYHQANMIPMMTVNTANVKTEDAIKLKSIGNKQNRTRQTHCQATLICLTKVIIKGRDKIK